MHSYVFDDYTFYFCNHNNLISAKLEINDMIIADEDFI